MTSVSKRVLVLSHIHCQANFGNISKSENEKFLDAF